MAADCGLPVDLAPYAERLFARFPEVLAALGQPSLPEEFHLPPASHLWCSALGGTVQIQDECGKKVVKVELPRRPNYALLHDTFQRAEAKQLSMRQQQRNEEAERYLTEQRFLEHQFAHCRDVAQNLLQQRLAEQQLAEQMRVKQHLVEQLAAKQRCVEEDRLAEPQLAEQPLADQFFMQQRLAQQQFSAQLGEQQCAGQHLAERRLTEQRLAEHGMAKQRLPEQQVAQQRQQVLQKEVREQLVSTMQKSKRAEQNYRESPEQSRRPELSGHVQQAERKEVPALAPKQCAAGRRSKSPRTEGLQTLKERRGMKLTMPVITKTSPKIRNKERPAFLANRGYNSPQFKQLAVQDPNRKRQRDRRGSFAHNAMIERPLPRAFPLRRTIIIFDWDDTLCPTSWISDILKAHLADDSQWDADLGGGDFVTGRGTIIEGRVGARMLGWKDQLPPWFSHPLPDEPEFQQAIRECEDRAIDALNAAQMFGAVCIVTNAMPGWVESTVKKWLPSLRPFISGHGVIRPIQVFYSQQEYARPAREMPWVDELGKHMAWKKAAMSTVLDHLDELYGLKSDGEHWPSNPSWIAGEEANRLLNLICIGDDECEMLAGELTAVERSIRRARQPHTRKSDPADERQLSTVSSSALVTHDAGSGIVEKDTLQPSLTRTITDEVGRMLMASRASPGMPAFPCRTAGGAAGRLGGRRGSHPDAKAAALPLFKTSPENCMDKSIDSSDDNSGAKSSSSSSSALTDSLDSDHEDEESGSQKPARRNQAPLRGQLRISQPPVPPGPSAMPSAKRRRDRTALSEPAARSRLPDMPWVKLVKLRTRPNVRHFTEQLTEVAKLLPQLSTLRRHLRVEFENDFSTLETREALRKPLGPYFKDVPFTPPDDVSAERMWYLQEPDARMRGGVWNAEAARIGRLLQTQMV